MTVTLYHGDCLEVLKTLEPGSVDAVVTDPPYCSGGRQAAGQRGEISKNGSRADSDWLTTDNMGTDTYLWFMRQFAGLCRLACSVGSPAYVFTDWRQYTTIVTAWESAGWTLKNVLVWDKAKGGAMGSWWRNNHEWVPIFVKGKARPLSTHSYFNTWIEPKPVSGLHPTVKPRGLMDYIVSSITPEDAVVLDPFMGSGTTGESAINLHRSFIGIEIDAGYYEIAERRIAEAQAQLRMEL